MKNYRIIVIVLSLLLGSASAVAQVYLEEPQHLPSGIYVTTYANFNGISTRSFTIRYDADARIALWVAYPLNKTLIGNGSRGDGWHPDPQIDESCQAILYKGFKYGSGYDRGHQIPSADRLDPATNEQTFQFTNSTPQLHDYNGGIWAELEKIVRTWAKRSDTLYVVTGIVPGKERISDNIGNSVMIPSAYYKVVLRKNTDKAGKCAWTANAVLLPHEVTPVGTWQENLALFKKHSLSIVDLEKITGECYFPLLKHIIGGPAYNQIKQNHPSENSWWWK